MSHLYGSQCNPLLHSALTRYEHSEPPSLGVPLSPGPPMDCPARFHLRWLKRCLLRAQITKPDSRFLIFIKSAKVWQNIIGAYLVLRQRTWQHRGVHGNRAAPAPLSSRGWSCRCSSLSHRPHIRGSLRWPMSATPYWLSGENTQRCDGQREESAFFFKKTQHNHAVDLIQANTLWSLMKQITVRTGMQSNQWVKPRPVHK